MKSAGGANVTFIGWRAAYLCKRLDMSKRSACLCVKSLFWKDLNFLPLSALETGRDVWLDFVEIIQEKADYKLHNKHAISYEPRSWDNGLHGASFYTRKLLTQLQNICQLKTIWGFSLWPFYEQSCHAGHSVVQTQIQLWGGGGVWQEGVCVCSIAP